MNLHPKEVSLRKETTWLIRFGSLLREFKMLKHDILKGKNFLKLNHYLYRYNMYPQILHNLLAPGSNFSQDSFLIYCMWYFSWRSTEKTLQVSHTLKRSFTIHRMPKGLISTFYLWFCVFPGFMAILWPVLWYISLSGVYLCPTFCCLILQRNLPAGQTTLAVLFLFSP